MSHPWSHAGGGRDWADLLEAIEIELPDRYRIGRHEERTDPGQDLEARLVEDLYLRLHLYPDSEPPEPRPPGPEAFRLSRDGEQATAARISSAVAPHIGPFWQAGWSLGDPPEAALGLDAENSARSGSESSVWVEKDGVKYRARREQVRASGSEQGIAPSPASRSCEVRVPAEQRDSLPGFYRLEQGWRAERQEPPTPGAKAVLRIYCNSDPLGRLPAFLARQIRIPFVLKCVTRRRWLGRSDAVLFFSDPAHWSILRSTFRIVATELRGHLRPATPPFALRLAPGLAVAEGPKDRTSFGHHRCRLLARALVLSAQAGIPRLEAVRAVFTDAGLDPSRPHLDASTITSGAPDPYRPFGPDPGEPS